MLDGETNKSPVYLDKEYVSARVTYVNIYKSVRREDPRKLYLQLIYSSR